jgi:hypothetical protein
MYILTQMLDGSRMRCIGPDSKADSKPDSKAIEKQSFELARMMGVR